MQAVQKATMLKTVYDSIRARDKGTIKESVFQIMLGFAPSWSSHSNKKARKRLFQEIARLNAIPPVEVTSIKVIHNEEHEIEQPLIDDTSDKHKYTDSMNKQLRDVHFKKQLQDLQHER
jgi:hypothetical protein